MKLIWTIPCLFLIALPTLLNAQNLTLSSEPSECNNCSGSIFVSANFTISDISIVITPTGSPVTFNTTVSGSNAVATGLCAGVYKVIVTDATNQLHEGVVTVDDISSGFTVTGAADNPSCAGSSDGSIIGFIQGGQPGVQYHFFWSNGVASPSLNDLAAGTYCVTVTEGSSTGGGCTATACFTLTAPCPLSATISQGSSNPIGSVNLYAIPSGGTGPYTYTWSNGISIPTIYPTQSGTYTTTVTDANGCTATASYTYNPNTSNFITGTVQNITCNNPQGTIFVTANAQFFGPGATFTVEGPTVTNQTPQIINNGNYTFVVTVDEPGIYYVCGYNIDNVTFCTPFTVTASSDYVIVPITSSNPAYCNTVSTPGGGTGTANCEKVCPNATFTYGIGNFTSCATPPASYTWTISGASSYTISPNGREVTITWGGPGSGLISLNGDSTQGCFSGTQCITIVDEPVADFKTQPASSNGFLSVCKGQSVQFTNTSLGTDLYEWTFGDDFSNSNETNPEHTFHIPGTHTVTLIARSLCLCSDTTQLTVEVLDAISPIVDCVNSLCPGEQVTYTTNSDCGTYNWTVSPNGTIINGGGVADTSITIQWVSGVEGTIGLTVAACSGSVCAANATILVPILSDQAEIQGKSRVCPEEETNYTIQEFDGAGYTWKVSPGGTITDGQGRPKITVKWGTSGAPQWVSVEYENCYLGCTGRDSIQVLIRPPFSIDSEIEGCAGSPQIFIAKQVPGNAPVVSDWYLFTPNGGQIATNSYSSLFNHTFDNSISGNYKMVAYPTGAGLNQTCSDSAVKKIFIAPLPPKPSGISGPLEFCAGKTLTYQAAGVSGQYNVTWTINKGNNQVVTETGNPLNTSFSGAAPHWIAARQVSTDGLGCQSDTTRLNLTSILPFNISGPTDICEGSLGTYTIPVFENVDYSWQIVPATAGTFKQGDKTNEVEVFWAEPGVHTLVATACGQTAVYQVSILANPVPTITSPAGLCPGATGVSISDGIYNIYQWKNANGNVIGNNIDVTTGPGNYALVVTDADGCRGTSEFTVEAWPTPNLNITTADPTGFCNNSSWVTIDALLDEDFEYEYAWYRDGVLVSNFGVSYSTNQYGFYTAQVTNQYGCTATDGPIEVFEYCGGGVCHNPGAAICPPGTLDFNATATMYCDSFNFQLVPNPLYLPGTIFWEFGESGSTILGTSTEETPGFKFPNAGHYIVFMRAELLNGMVCTVVDSVQVDAAANFSYLQDCPGTPTTFKDESTFLPDAGITTWKWDFNDYAAANSDSSVLRNPEWIYSNSGFYNAKLTITAPSGCISEEIKQIKIPVPPPVVFAPQVPDCAGNATPLAVQNSPTLIGAHWNFGDPASGSLDSISGFSVVHRYNTAGTYTATATVTNIDGCSNSSTLSVPIVPNTLAGLITPASPTFCEGSSILISAPAGPTGSTYTWSDGSNAKDLLVITEGTYSVTITSPDGCTYVPTPKAVDVLPAPDGSIRALLYNDLGQLEGAQNNALEVCFGEDVHLEVADNGAYNYNWSSGGNDEELLFTEDRGNLLGPGAYTYTVTITGSNGCSLVPPPFQVLVHDVPGGFTATTNQNCAGTPSTVTYNGPQPAGWQYVWNSGDVGTSFVTEEPGRYFVRVINQFGCVAESNRVTIHPGPNIAAIPGGCHTRCTPDTMCITPLPDIVNWQWFYEGTPISGATSSQIVATQSGNYYAVLTDVNGCIAQSDDLSLTLFTGYGDINGQVWSDVNNNGIIDGSDTLVSNVPLQLWQNGAVLNTQNSINGNFSFQNILSTQYEVSLDTLNLDPAWEIVIGANPTELVGCDDKENVGLLIRKVTCPTFTTALTATACANGFYTYNGTNISAGTSQSFTFSNLVTGCDTIVTVTVAALPVATSSLAVQICPGDTYTYENASLAVGQTQQFTLTNPANGCDSLVTVTVAALPVATSSLAVQICPGDTYTYENASLAVGQTQQFTLTNPANGCDSLVTVTVAALPVATSSFAVQICPGDTYTYENASLAVGQTQQFTLTNPANGCDSLVTVTVGALPVATSSLAVQICPGDTYTYENASLAVGQSQQFTLTNPANGCDSLVTVTVAALPVATSNMLVKICEDGLFNYQNTSLAPGQTQQFTLTNPATGCDSLVNVTVEGLALPVNEITVNICPKTTYLYNGQQLLPDSTYEFHYNTTPENCDSTVFITVNAWPELNYKIDAVSSCYNSPTGTVALNNVTGSLPVEWKWGTNNFSTTLNADELAPGTYTVTIRDANGCLYTDDFDVIQRLPMQVDAPNALALPCEEPLVKLFPLVSGDLTGIRWLWNTGDTTASILTDQIGTYAVKITNECETVERKIEVQWADGPDNKEFVYVPNVFDPDAIDSENSQFRAFVSPNVELISFKMEVFDRWGNLEFRTLNAEDAWNANVRKKMADTAVYVWYMEVEILYCGQTAKIRKKGDVTVVR